jgi:hypothetical protein
MPDRIEFSLPDTIALLVRTPATLNALLRELPDTWAHADEGEGTWSAFDILGHLIVGERTDWMPRARIILEHGEARPFDPFDRNAQFEESRDKSLLQLLDEFARRGTHPAFGSVTLAQLLATWAVHDLTHLHQLSRVLASQYRDAVGPWTAYLGVLRCDGHGS